MATSIDALGTGHGHDGSRSSLVYQELPSDDALQRQPDISRAETTLDWRPSVQLEAGLKQMVDYFRNLMQTEAVRT